MAITQFSKIKLRSGLFVDLPAPLSGHELGHALDERRLFIGNGEVSDGAPTVGNTEILTEFSPLMDVIKHIYKSNTNVTAVTGDNVSSPVIRSLQEIIDDRLSIKSYDAKGDGVTDDVEAINRALKNVYTDETIPEENGFRLIYIPAGVYRIYSDSIYLPPNTILMGDGKGRTVILLDNPASDVAVRTADSLFQSDLQMGSSGATLPFNISLIGITFKTNNDNSLLSLERSSFVEIHDCEFIGGYTGGISSSFGIAIDALGDIYQPMNISVDNCGFENVSRAIDIKNGLDNPTNFNVSSSKIKNTKTGIIDMSGYKNLIIVESSFENIEETAILFNENSSHCVTSNNMFTLCGDSTNPVIVFDKASNEAMYCSSTNDRFDISPGVSFIKNEGADNLILNPQTNITFNNVEITKKNGPIVLMAGQTNGSTGISLDTTVNNSMFIDYVAHRGSDTRIGTIYITSNGSLSGTTIGDLNAENNPMGLSFDISFTGNTVNLLYNTTIGDDINLSFQIKNWKI